MAVNTTVSNIPTPPKRGVDSQTVFVTKGEAVFDALHDTVIGQMNTAFGEINTTETNINAKEASAVAASSTATAAANNKGSWSALTGALNIPASVNHNDSTWILNTNLADVTLSEPTDINTDWTKVALNVNSATNITLTGSITEEVYNLTGTVIDPTNGTIEYKVLSAATTFTENLASGQGIILRLAGGDAHIVTFPATIWVTGVAPILTANDVIVFWKEGTTLFGSWVGTVVQA